MMIKYFVMPEAMGGRSSLDLLDNGLVYLCTGFGFFAIGMALHVLYNKRMRTSVPGRLRPKVWI